MVIYNTVKCTNTSQAAWFVLIEFKIPKNFVFDWSINSFLLVFTGSY